MTITKKNINRTVTPHAHKSTTTPKTRVAQPPVAAARKPLPKAPAVYQPQPTARTVQQKAASVERPQVNHPRRPVAPPVYRPEAAKIVQAKMAPAGQSVARAPLAPRSIHSRGVIQRAQAPPRPPAPNPPAAKPPAAKPPAAKPPAANPAATNPQRWYYCRKCEQTVASAGYPRDVLCRCNVSHSWVEGDLPSKTKVAPWVSAVKSAERAAHAAMMLISKNAVEAKKKPRSRLALKDYPPKFQDLIEHCKVVSRFLTNINMLEDIYDIDRLSKSNLSPEQIIQCYKAIEGMMLAIAGLNDQDWALLNQVGIGDYLRAWVGSEKRCITTLADELVKMV